MNYSIIAMDMDDTLLNSNLQISEADARSLQKAEEAGIRVVLCSGRPTASIKKYARSLFGKSYDTKERYIISFNGACITRLDTDEEIFHLGVPQDLAKELMVLSRKFGIVAQHYKGDKFFVEQDCPEAKRYKESTGLDYEAVGALEAFIDNDPLKILFHSEPEKIVLIEPEVRALVGDRIYAVQSKPQYLECLNKEVNKGKALKSLARQLNISRENIIAVGDAPNDIEMLEFAGTGVAVSNARQDVKAKADVVLKNSHDEDPITAVLEQLVFQRA